MRQERSIMKASRPASWKFQIITSLSCTSGANIFCIILGFKVQFNGKYTPLSGYWMHYTSNYVDGKREINWANSQWCPYPHTERTTAQSSLSPGRVQCENYSWNYFYDRPLCRGRASWIWRAGSSCYIAQPPSPRPCSTWPGHMLRSLASYWHSNCSLSTFSTRDTDD